MNTNDENRNLENAYRPISLFAVLCTLFFVGNGIIGTLAAFSTAGQIQILDNARFGVRFGVEQAEANDFRQRLFATIEISTWCAASVLFLVWLYAASFNACIIRSKDMHFGPGWSVGWFFVPLANWFMPYFVMRELWKASSSPNVKWRQSFTSPILPAWWVSLVLLSVLKFGPIPTLLGNRKLE